MRWAVPLGALVLACMEAAPDPGGVRELVARERAFAALSVDSGMRPAFLTFLADSSVLFRPHPVPGRAWMAGRPDPPGILNWRPTFAMVSGRRDLGWTTGPYTYTLEGDTSHGHFVSVWKREAPGRWEVWLDLGVSHPPEDVRDHIDHISLPSADAGTPAALRIDLLRRDRLLLNAARTNMRRAFTEGYAPNAQMYRPGDVPTLLRADWLRALPTGPTTLNWEPTDARASSGGDLGVTLGALTGSGNPGWRIPAGSYRYVRIWRREAERWQVILEIVVPGR
ncbi:MAG: nuclear transport factor 2 family protein [Gemmatimonadales bacterium]